MLRIVRLVTGRNLGRALSHTNSIAFSPVFRQTRLFSSNRDDDEKRRRRDLLNRKKRQVDETDQERDKDQEENTDDVIDAESKPRNGRTGRFVAVGNRRRLGRGLDPSDDAENEDESFPIDKIHVPKVYPQLLPIPLTKRPLFPGFYKSLHVTDPAVIQAIESLWERRQPYIGIFLSKNDKSQLDAVENMDEIHPVGVFAQITNIYPAGPDNSAMTVVIFPHRRIRATELVDGQVTDVEPAEGEETKEASETEEKAINEEENEKLMPINKHLAELNLKVMNVENLEDEPCDSDNPVIKALTSETLNVLKEISQINPLLRDQIIQFSIQSGGNSFHDPARLADFSAAVSSGMSMELQEVLESLVIEDRLQKSLLVLKKELANAKLQQEISKQVDQKITRKQQEYFLMEQLKGIKKELGMESDGKDKLVEKFKRKALALNMSDEVKTVFDEELNKLQSLEPTASEYNVTRNYLDWLTSVPWGNYSPENFDIKHASKVLNEDHYGLKDVKERILEFIAVGKLRGTIQGKILCLAGPPGVGKTSVGKSIARALDREFYRFSVGGLTDVSEIKGHRRTYVGAMPGKVVQALKRVQKGNPLIMIDEVDKIGKGHQGDPASALLELLDPEQNMSFIDHYMDVPVDLSKVLFVCTANVLDTIPGPLLDRMEVINVSGYITEEKMAIAQNYLIPTTLESHGLKDSKVEFSDEGLEYLIRYYCRESGVRNLKKKIEKICRKIAMIVVNDELKDGIVVTKEKVKEYLGSPVYQDDRLYESTPVGVVTGLAWTAMGGSTLYIESVLKSPLSEKSKPSFEYTGQMGNVMQESAKIAYTYASAFLSRKYPEMNFFQHANVHLHVPEGATPKDGPSAGITMTSSLLSLALQKPIPLYSMTGELSLTGKILKIGGVKEKILATKRSGVFDVILPKDNKSDFDELDPEVKKGVNVRFCADYEEVFDILFQK